MQTNYTEQCLRKFVDAKESYHCRIRFEVWYNEINIFFIMTTKIILTCIILSRL